MSYSLNGKTAIVTGAASGLGLAVARHFVERGANVMFADRDDERLTAELGPNNEDSTWRVFSCDLRQKLSVSNLISATYDAFGRIDILVNAARMIEQSDPLVPEADAVESLWQANVMATLRLSQHVARRMIQQAEEGAEGDVGTIVNISSLAAERSRPELMGFALATAGVEQMTRSLALALAPERIRVNAIGIGSVMTASLQSFLKDRPEMRDEMIALTPLGRIASLREVVETAQFLASDASSFMTGQVLRVDGGRSLVEPAAGSYY